MKNFSRFRQNWWNGFGLGIICGSCLAIVIGVWLIAPPVTTNDDGRWWIIPNVAHMDDTVAQWTMTIFTIFAVYLLLRTLRATQEMALDARRIGEAQVRAYISVSKVVVTPYRVGEEFCLNFRCRIQNSGQSPARRVEATARAGNMHSGKHILSDIEPGGCVTAEIDVSVPSKELLSFDDGRISVFAYFDVFFEDVFARIGEKSRESADFTSIFEPQDGKTVGMHSIGRTGSDVLKGDLPSRE